MLWEAKVGVNMKRIKFDRDSTIRSATRMPSWYLLYWGVRVQNKTRHKWTPRCGSPLFGKISPDRRSTAAVRSSLLYILSFIGGAREKEEEKEDRSADGAFSTSMNSLFSISSFPTSLCFSLFANESRNKIFETRAQILGSRVLAAFLYFLLSIPFFLFSFFLIFNLVGFFFFSFSNISQIHR